MAPPSRPVTLIAEQVVELNQKLSCLRHDINNHLSVMIEAIELTRTKPQMAERMISTLVEQPSKIAGALHRFSTEFEQTFGVARPKLASSSQDRTGVFAEEL